MKGFTLIELLVVVLIIGILSSVALPQYTKAVEKARMTEATATMEALAKGLQMYYLSNGNMLINSLDDLDIDVTKSFTCTDEGGSSGECVSKNWRHHWSCWDSTCELESWRLKGADSPYILQWEVNSSGVYDRNCLTYTDEGDSFCKSLIGQGWWLDKQH